MAASAYEYPFDPDEPNNTAASVFRLARQGGTRVLDLGSGPGIVAGALAHLADKEVTCVDAEDRSLEAAAERGVQRTIAADLTGPTWREKLAGEQFDVIILADVLEHLVHPGELLSQIRDRELLASDGHLVISFPNASHIAILALLATGDFPYRPAGLLDETHLRFFTLTSMRRMLEEHGFGINRIRRTTRRLAQTGFADVALRLSPDALRALHEQHDEADTFQYVLRVQPLVAAETVALRDEVQRLRRRARKLEQQRRQALNKRDAARADAEELGRRLTEVRASSTWRAGRLLVGAPAAIRRRLSAS